MRNHSFPLEIIKEIAMWLPPPERVSLVLACKRWNSHLYPVVLHTVNILTRRKLASFITYLEKYKSVGRHVKELYVKNNVGLEPKQYSTICKECPLLLVFQFSSWRNYQIGSLAAFSQLQQIPRISGIPEGLDALNTCGKTLTHLSFSETVMVVLVSQNLVIELLKLTPNLTHLELCGSTLYTAESMRLRFDDITWNTLQQHCMHLTNIKMENLSLESLLPEADESNLISVKKYENMKGLSFTNVNMQDYRWLKKIVYMYPKLTYLKLDFEKSSRIRTQQNRPHTTFNQWECSNAFLFLASGLRHMKHVEFLNIEERKFPGGSYFELLAETGVQLDEMALHLNEPIGTYHRSRFYLSKHNALLSTQQNTLRALDLKVYYNGNIDTDIVEPMSICKHLSKIKLEGGFFTTRRQSISLDTILDTCPRLQELNLKGFVISCTDKTSNNIHHLLKSLNITQSVVFEPVFAYLGTHCSQMTHMSVEDCQLKTTSRRRRVKIIMMNNVFQSLCINLIDINSNKSGPPLMNSLTTNPISVILTTQIDKVKKKRARDTKENTITTLTVNPRIDSSWYCVYDNDEGRHVRKLRRKESIACFKITDKMKRKQAAIEDFTMNERKPWKTEARKGHIYFICKSVERLVFNHVDIVYR